MSARARPRRLGAPLELLLVQLLQRCAEAAGQTVEEHTEAILAVWDGSVRDAEVLAAIAQKAARS
jgi:hypothetical protein